MWSTLSVRIGRAVIVLSCGLALALPAWQAHQERCSLQRRLSHAGAIDDDLARWPATSTSPLLASWQSVGGCGASAASGGGVGVKWIGRNVSGGLFNVQSQGSYTQVHSVYLEDQFVLNNLITRDVSEKVQLGVNVPMVYKYLHDPYHLDIDLANSGLGDVSVQGLYRAGAINDTLITGTVGLPTGTYDQRYRRAPLRGHSQLGFGKVTGTLMVDHVQDRVSGLIVTGGTVAWRGGENSMSNYRAPSASGYAFSGWFWGRFVPALGLSVTGFAGHDRDQGQDEDSALAQAAPTLSLEWASDWVALLAGASFPYQYNGVTKDSNGKPVSPWGWGDWTVSLGVSFAPF